MYSLARYGNSNLPIQYGNKIDLGIKLKLKEVVTPLPFIIFSICAFMIFSLSINYTSIEPTIVLAQESNQVSVNENSIIQSNNNVTQLPTTFANDKK